MVILEAVNDESQKSQKVHRDVACHYSPIFKAAFNSNFVEGQTQTYRLEDVSQQTVKSLIHVSVPSPAIFLAFSQGKNGIGVFRLVQLHIDQYDCKI